MMLGNTDYVGIGVVITSIGTAAAAVIAAIASVRTHTVASATQDAVTTSNGATIGDIAEKVSAQLDAQDVASEAKK
jgi:hypothetical protein